MHHRRNFVVGKGSRQRGAVEEISNHQGRGDEAAMTCRKIVIDDGLKAGGNQCAAGVRTDIAGTSLTRTVGRSCQCFLGN